MDRSSFFQNCSRIFKGEATGRLDVMGGIADYSGSLVLQMPIRESAKVYIAPTDTHSIHIHSTEAEAIGKKADVTIPLELIFNLSDSSITNDDSHIPTWTKYIIGAWPILLRYKNTKPGGARIWIDSEVPVGKGVSSSAALEIATLRALETWMDLEWKSPYEMAILGQKIENEIVGAPCGIMDQIVICLGQRGTLLPLLCQPHDASPLLHIPKDIHFVGLDSGTRHEVGGASYTDVRTAAFMGYSIISNSIRAFGSKDDEPPFDGYLANVSREDFVSNYRHLLPQNMTGRHFLDKYGRTPDTVTQPQGNISYRIKHATAHPIFENERIHRFQVLLKNYSKANKSWTLRHMGKCMYESHESYSRCGLGSSATDQIVQLTKKYGSESNVYGARITGGGNGGTVCILAFGNEGLATVRSIKQAMETETGKNLTLFLP